MNDFYVPNANDQDDMMRAMQEAEAHCERLELSMEALEWAQEHGMPEDMLKHLAYECNVKFVQIGKEKHAAY